MSEDQRIFNVVASLFYCTEDMLRVLNDATKFANVCISLVGSPNHLYLNAAPKQVQGASHMLAWLPRICYLWPKEKTNLEIFQSSL